MGIYYKELEEHFSHILKKLINDILINFENFKIYFIDPDEYTHATGDDFLPEGNGANYADRERELLVIILKESYYERRINRRINRVAPSYFIFQNNIVENNSETLKQ